MKETFVWIGLAALLAMRSYGGNEAIVKERAKELRNQNNVRQGIAPPTQSSAPGSAATPTPALSPSLVKVQNVLATIPAGSVVSADQKQQVTQGLLAGAQGAKPSSADAARLADGLTAAVAAYPLSSASRARLMQELDAVLNPSKYPQARLEGIFADIQAIFQDSGLSRSKSIALVDSVKAIAAGVRR